MTDRLPGRFPPHDVQDLEALEVELDHERTLEGRLDELRLIARITEVAR